MSTAPSFRALERAARRLAVAAMHAGRPAPGVLSVDRARVELSEAAILYAARYRADVAEAAEVSA